MVENKDIRKLSLYSQDNKFNTSIEAVAIDCFVHLVDLTVQKKNDIKELKARVEAEYFLVSEY